MEKENQHYRMYENTAHKITLLRQKRLHPRLWYAQFSLAPFSHSQALTVAHVLRRVLLSEIETTACTGVKIEGVFHELSLLPGIQESIPEIITNIRNLVFTNLPQKTENQPTRAQIFHHGKKIVTAKDINLPSHLQVVDPAQPIATLVSDHSVFSVDMHLTESKGYSQPSGCVGSSPFQESKSPSPLLPIDAVFLPVKKVNYVLQHHSYHESIVFEIWTDGSISPQKALAKASFALRTLFSPFTSTSA